MTIPRRYLAVLLLTIGTAAQLAVADTAWGSVTLPKDDPLRAKLYTDGPVEWAKVLAGLPGRHGTYTEHIEKFDGASGSPATATLDRRYSVEYFVDPSHDCARYNCLCEPNDGSERVESTNADYSFRIDRLTAKGRFALVHFMGPGGYSTRHEGSDGLLSDKCWNIDRLRILFSAAAAGPMTLPSILQSGGLPVTALSSVTEGGRQLVRLDYNITSFAGSIHSEPLKSVCSVWVDPGFHWAVRKYVTNYKAGSETGTVDYADGATPICPSRTASEDRDLHGALYVRTTRTFDAPVLASGHDESFRLEAYGLVPPGSIGTGSRFVLINAVVLLVAALIFLVLSRRKRRQASGT